MAKITLDTDQLKDLFSGDEPMRVLLEEVFNKVLKTDSQNKMPVWNSLHDSSTGKRRVPDNHFSGKQITA